MLLSLAQRWGVKRCACVAAVLVALPTLGMGLFIDDYVHLLSLEGKVAGTSPLDLFHFAPGNPELLQTYMGQVPYPWFTLPELKIRFFRPLSSGLMWLEHAIFGRAPFIYHVHSIAWYALLCTLAAALYGRLFSLPLALLCALLFVVDDGHAIPAGWWSNRNAVVSAAGALGALLAHMQWRDSRKIRYLILSLLSLTLGLLGGESSLGVLGYLAAYEVFGRARTGGGAGQRWSALRASVAALMPIAGLSIAYLLLYKWLGNGVHGSGIYFDPLGEMIPFLKHVPERAALLIGAQFASLPAELPIVIPSLRWPLVAAGTVTMFVFGGLLRAVWPSLSPEERRHLSWLILGGSLAAAPVLATFPSGRLLVLPSLGAAAVVAVIVRAAYRHWTRKLSARLLFLLLFGIHGIAAFCYWPVLSAGVRFIDAQARQELNRALDTEIPPQANVIMLNAADPLMGMYPQILLTYLRPDAAPVRWWSIVLNPHELEVSAVDAHTVEIRILSGALLQTDFEKLFRSPAFPLPLGEAIGAGSLSVTLLDVPENAPAVLRVHISPELSPGVTWLRWSAEGFRSYTPVKAPQTEKISPAVGFFDLRFLLRRIRAPAKSSEGEAGDG